jgi:hypothetical protein
MALLPGSPALDAGDPAQLGSTDQRGVMRTGGVNIGAYQASATIFLVAATDTVQAGTPFDVTVTALDPFGQLALGYTGTVTFSSADPYGATLPGDYTFTLDDQGVATFAAGATLYTAGTWDVTVMDNSSPISGTALVLVTPAPASQFAVTAPTTSVAGVPFDVTVTALDPYGNTDVNYQGTVTFSTSDPDPGVVLPGDYTFTPADSGVHTFTDTGSGETTLVTAGDQTLTVSDTANDTITGSAIITVSAGPAPGPHGLGPLVSRFQASPGRAKTERSADAVAGLDRWFASFHGGDFAWLTLTRLRHHARGETDSGLADLFGGEDLLLV